MHQGICAPLPGCRQWGGIAFALTPQLCRLTETAGQVAANRQREMLGYLLSCLRQFAEIGLADEAVRAGGGRLLATTTELYLVSTLPSQCAFSGAGPQRVANRPNVKALVLACTVENKLKHSIIAESCTG